MGDPAVDANDHRRDLDRVLPELLHRCKSSRELTERTAERARRALETARAIRSLVQSHAEGVSSKRATSPDVWTEAAGKIVRLAGERDRGLGILSHELRQALNAALTAERLLAISADANAATRAHGVLHRQLLHMSRLVEDLLDFSRLSLHGGAIGRGECDVREVVALALETIEAHIAERGQHLSVAQPADPQIVVGDATRLRQVVSNLLHNASRYTPPGGTITVTVSPAPDGVSIEVADTGEGIDREQLAVIFEPFVRRSGEGSGLGIGLALAKRFVELHGGTIAVRSDGRGRGSVFSVRLPLALRS